MKQATTATATKSSHRYEDDNLKITVPVYVGISYETSRRIMEILRSRSEAEERSEGSLKVATATMTREQAAIEQRLRVDFFTLRHVLFNSLKTWMSLDLALRIQEEVKDELVFITPENIQSAWENSIQHYHYYAEKK